MHIVIEMERVSDDHEGLATEGGYLDIHEHRWGVEYHTHLGHEVFGAHAANWDCLACSDVRMFSFSEQKEYILSGAQRLKHFWRILPEPHECSSGWRGMRVHHRAVWP